MGGGLCVCARGGERATAPCVGVWHRFRPLCSPPPSRACHAPSPSFPRLPFPPCPRHATPSTRSVRPSAVTQDPLLSLPANGRASWCPLSLFLPYVFPPLNVRRPLPTPPGFPCSRRPLSIL